MFYALNSDRTVVELQVVKASRTIIPRRTTRRQRSSRSILATWIKSGRGRTVRTVGVRSVPLVADARQLPRDVTSGAADRQRVECSPLPCPAVAGYRRVRTSDHCSQHTYIIHTHTYTSLR